MTRFATARRAALGAACLLAAGAIPAVSWSQRTGGGRRGIDISALGSPNDFYSPPKFAGNPAYDGRFTFARIKYRGFRHWSGNEGPGWSHDYPEADEHLMRILQEVTSARPFIGKGAARGGAIVALDDPGLFRYPVSYLSEPGGWYPTEAEVKGLRAYLLKGGFVIVDDFGGGDWANFSTQIARVLPNVRPVTLSGKEPIFDSFYKVDVSNMRTYRGRAVFMGIYENNDPGKRLMMILNVNADVGEGWQWAGSGFVAVDVSNEGFKLGVNYMVYSLTH